MPFTSETGRAVRLKALDGHVNQFDKRAWLRSWMRRERARRRAVGLCQRCGVELVERFHDCQRCRVRECARKRAQREAA